MKSPLGTSVEIVTNKAVFDVVNEIVHTVSNIVFKDTYFSKAISE